MSSLLPELEAEIDAFKVVDPTIGQELAELSVLKILGKYQTANIELQAIQAPSGKVSDHEKLLETIRAGETECGALAKEYENGNYEADPEPCLSAVEELKRLSKIKKKRPPIAGGLSSFIRVFAHRRCLGRSGTNSQGPRLPSKHPR